MNIPASKIITWLLIFFILGIGISSFLLFPLFVVLPFFFLILIVLFFAKRQFLIENIRTIILIFLFFLLGVWRYQISFPVQDENYLGFYNNQKVNFIGKVVKEPEQRDREVELVLGGIKIKEKEIKGKMLVRVPLYSLYERNDLLQISCPLKQPGIIEDFNYDEYLSRYNVYSVCYWPEIKVLERGDFSGIVAKIFWFRNQSKKLIDQYFTEPQDAFLSALLLGFKKQIPEEIRNWFTRTGMTHVLAISGLHISIFSQIIAFFLTGVLLLRRQKVFWPTALIVIFFVILVGVPASAVRAAIMGLGLAWAQKIGRPQVGKKIILYAAAIMLCFNPKLLKLDIGFQLSFLAVLGISFLSPAFNQYFKKIPNFQYFPLRQYLATTLGAQVFVLPLILYYFGDLSLISPLINVLVLFFIPLIMALGLLFIIFGLIHICLAKIFFYPLWLLLTFVILTVKVGAFIPGFSYVIDNFPLSLTIILYFLIVFWLVKIKKQNNEIEEI
ncbi:MAG: ComEC/Rec2 family competence protein [Patescibacteria group bacterium]|nr:ComEC/Rec2 family competence protein [Patescibacteria group bacterium]